MDDRTVAPYPHEGGCPECRMLRVCNYCGGIARLGERCTNGRCGNCHHRVCGGGGVTSPGHSYGVQGGKHYARPVR